MDGDNEETQYTPIRMSAPVYEVQKYSYKRKPLPSRPKIIDTAGTLGDRTNGATFNSSIFNGTL